MKLSKRGLKLFQLDLIAGISGHTASSTCSSLSLGIIAEAVLSVFPM